MLQGPGVGSWGVRGEELRRVGGLAAGGLTYQSRVVALVRWLYRRFDGHYRYLLFGSQAGASVVVSMLAVLMLGRFYDRTVTEVLTVLAVTAVSTVLAVGYAALRIRPVVLEIDRWRSLDTPTPRETVAAWRLATSLNYEQYRSTGLQVSALAVVPSCVAAAVLWDLGWPGLAAVLVAAALIAAYATVLGFNVGEIMLAPIVADIADQLPDGFGFARAGLTLDRRIRLWLPIYALVAGVLVAGLTDSGGGSRRMLLTIGISLAVGLFVSRELTTFLTNSITAPIEQIRLQLGRVRAGDYSTRVPVVTNDELGELSHEVNQMTRGLAEREELRDTFGTYVDHQIVELILSGRFPREGVSADVSILFCDVRGFTAYAEQVDATEVIATLNEIFSDIVPVIEQLGGHVDKFLGDGLLAVFGVPEFHHDHADRAVEAAQMLVDVVGAGSTGLRVAAGVNSGPVVAGPLGGAGRLNFSVIGDAVNIAARVEAATRSTGDDVLLTAATADLLVREHDLVSRGPMKLKGKSEPVELFALRSLDPTDESLLAQVTQRLRRLGPT